MENRTIQESLIGIGLVGGVGGALGVYGKYTDGKRLAQMKELVQKAHEGMTVKFAANGKGEADAAELALADFCQALLGLNEFIYVD